MCTAISYKTKNHYFGRNLDYEYSYDEAVTITPRNYPFMFRKMGRMDKHYAMIGMAYVIDGYPLYFDATNEKGLSMAGLLFSGNAIYKEAVEEKDNISPFEFIPWTLSQCASVEEAVRLLNKINLADIPYSEELALTPLHWMIADSGRSIVVEPLAEGLKIHENPVGVLTNNPPFEYQIMNLNLYAGLTRVQPKTNFGQGIDMKLYSRGMGAIGLPGDLSSMSRFVRGVFHKSNAEAGTSEQESVNQFFHLLGSVEMPRGSLELESGMFAITTYSACCNTDKGIYYFRTYENQQIRGVDMYRENLEGKNVKCYKIMNSTEISIINGE